MKLIFMTGMKRKCSLSMQQDYGKTYYPLPEFHYDILGLITEVGRDFNTESLVNGNNFKLPDEAIKYLVKH